MFVFQTEENNYYDIIYKLKNEVTYGGYFAALCSPAFVLFTAGLMNIKVDIPILVISYLLPLIVYSYDYYRDVDKDIRENSKRAIFLKNKVKRYPFVLGFYIMLLFTLLIIFFNLNLILFIIMLIIIGILYNIALKDLTKKIPLFKNIYTAITWALGGAIFPLLYYSMDFSPIITIAFLVIFIRCLNNIIFFDLKDMENDRKEKLKTLPVILGKKATIKFLHTLNIISLILIAFGVYINAIPLFAVSLMFLGIYSFYYIRKAETKDKKELETLSHTLADFEFIMWPILLAIAQFVI